MGWMAERCFLLMGWRFVGSFPDVPKAVAVGYPHTTNWDFLVFLAIAHRFRMRVTFFAHRGLFVGPIGRILRSMGAIPVQGEASGASIVEDAIERFADADEMILAIAPEGTRAADARWRSGFWRIAEGAGVPVVMGFVDRPTKQLGLGPAARIDGDPERWMQLARAFYADKHGLRPGRRGQLELTSRT